MLTIAAEDKSKVYGSANPVLTLSYIGFVNGDTETSFTNPPTIKTLATAGSPAGIYAITVSGAGTTNYTVVYASGSLTISKAVLTIAADNKNRPYGANNPILTVSYRGFLNGDDSSSLTTQPTTSTTAKINSSIGSYPITASGVLSKNYVINYIPGTLTVSGGNILTVTANNQSKVYGSANPILSLSYSGFVNGDSEASFAQLPIVATTVKADSPAGTYPITVSGAKLQNYTLVYVPGTLTVNKAILTVTADNKSRPYGLNNPTLTASYGGFVNGDDTTSLGTQPVIVTSATTVAKPGNYPIKVSGAVSANYSFKYINGTFTITPSTNAELINLTLNSGTLSPAFKTDTHSYNASVENTVDRLLLTPTLNDPIAAVLINSRTSRNVLLNVGNNIINIDVIAQDGMVRSTYILKVYRGEPMASVTANNILTPNGDGKNDTWIIKDIALYPDNTVTIYDKAGRMIYSKHGYNNEWDGSLNGAPLTQGTYYYIVDLGRGYRQFKGFITIIKSRQ